MSETSKRPTFPVVSVRFQPAGKLYHFKGLPDLSLKTNDWVVVETVYGDQVGRVAQVQTLPSSTPDYAQLKTVRRLAGGLDMARHQVGKERAQRLTEIAKDEIRSLHLELKVVMVEFALDGNTALVMVTGNVNKKSLSTLRRRLAGRMKCKINLRTVGLRDHAKALGGYGMCGAPLCCSRFLTDFQAVSIRMAKDQGISMAPSDITGMCGRLRCCLAYEHEVYKEAGSQLPKLKARVRTSKGLGRVIDRDILKGILVVEIPPDGPKYRRERFRFAVDEVEVVTTTPTPKSKPTPKK